VNNGIRLRMERLAGQMREITMEMPHTRRQFDLVLASMKDGDLMP
jgi:hypothetical protein